MKPTPPKNLWAQMENVRRASKYTDSRLIDPNYLAPREAAKYLGFSACTLREYRRFGKPPCPTKVPAPGIGRMGYVLRYQKSVLDEFLKERRSA